MRRRIGAGHVAHWRRSLRARRAVGVGLGAVGAVQFFGAVCVKIIHCPRTKKRLCSPKEQGRFFFFLAEFWAKKDAAEEDWKNLCGVDGADEYCRSLS